MNSLSIEEYRAAPEGLPKEHPQLSEGVGVFAVRYERSRLGVVG